MSPPERHTETQAKRHKPALIGIAAAIIVAALVAIITLLIPRMPAEEQATPVPAPDGAAIEAAEEEEAQ